MAKLNKLAKMVATAKKNNLADSFVEDLIYTITQIDKDDIRTPSKAFKPSGVGGCERSMYYELSGVTPDEEPASVNLIGICESGTDRHERIQDYVMRMKDYNIDCEWLDVGEFLTARGVTDPQIIERTGNETKLYSEKYNMRFMCDGLIRYKDQLYIIEIKTETTHKYNRHNEPHAEHKSQATCYSLCLDVPNVIFIYEDRDNCSKKGYLVEVTPAMKNTVVDKLNYVNDHVEKNQVPPRTLNTKHCTYCNYNSTCIKDGE